MQIGLSTYSYTWSFGVPGFVPRNPMTAFDLVAVAARNNVGVIQIADNCPLHQFSAADLANLRALAREHRVRIEVGMRGLQVEAVRSYLDIARQMDSDILRVVIDSPGFEPSVEEVLNLIASLIPYMAHNGIRLAIENHDRFRGREFARMVAESDPVWVGICLDTVNSMGAGEGVAEVVATLAPLAINLHLKDFVVRRASHKMGLVVEGCPAGQGMLDYAGLIRTVESYGRCRSAILELWTPPEADVEKTISKEAAWVEESLSTLRASGQLVWGDVLSVT